MNKRLTTFAVYGLASLTGLLGSACERKVAPSPLATVTTQAAPTASVPATTAPRASGAERIKTEQSKIRKKGSVVHLAWQIPKGTSVNDEGPFRLRWKTSEGLIEVPEERTDKGQAVADGLDVAVKPAPEADEAKLVGEISMVVCDSETHSVCVPIKRTIEMSFAVYADAPEKSSVQVPLPRAK
jgi:hypothetical protein